MGISSELNALSKLTLIASDAAYFTPAYPVALGSELVPLFDPDDILPAYDLIAASAFTAVRKFDDSATFNTGFKAIVYKKAATANTSAEYIIAFGGTDGRNATDWLANTQLGWKQWEDNSRDILAFLSTLEPNAQIDFTGQSLGGALAQYAAYTYIAQNPDPSAISRTTLTTFNGVGGVKALQQNLFTDFNLSFDSNLLDGLLMSAHYYVTNDVVSRLGGGHVGGLEYRLDFRGIKINKVTGKDYYLDPFDAHRIETGFYAHLYPGREFLDADSNFPITPLKLNHLQESAALFGNLLTAA